jgi:hypothetical protein
LSSLLWPGDIAAVTLADTAPVEEAAVAKTAAVALAVAALVEGTALAVAIYKNHFTK